jgi:GntR family transcriptional regulator, transcriptional repressor for pyruvate dehydrogenase complex
MDGFEVEPARPRPAYQVVVDHLKRAIQLGRYLPGDQLPGERELAQQLKVSRTTLREASRTLEGEGLIETRRGRYGGMVVLEPKMSAGARRALLQAKRKEIETVFEFRLTIESATAALAAQRRTSADLKKLASLVDRMVELVEANRREPGVPPYRWAAADTKFHMAIAEIARNELLEQAVANARAAMFEPLGVIFTTITPDVNDLHEEIFVAIREKDADAAREAMARHIGLTLQQVESSLGRGTH